MHERNYVHTRIHPESVRNRGIKNCVLSRLMYVQKWSEAKPCKGPIPTDPRDYFYISPERFRQEIETARVFEPNRPTDLVKAEKERLFPTDDDQWDAKMDDVYGFGCLTYFILVGTHPFTPMHAPARSLLQAFINNYLVNTITAHPTLSRQAKDFLLWILKPQQYQRPSMEEIVNHPFIQSEWGISPDKRNFMSNDPAVYGKTFRQVRGYINDDLVAQMAQEGFMIQHLLGEGGFGAVYK